MDKSGTVLDDNDSYPWGGAVPGVGQTTSNNHYKFTGKERDAETQLDYFGARYYANVTGRFMSPDWDGKPTTVPYAEFGDPQSLNLYSYARNIPTTRIDPDGHFNDPFNIFGGGGDFSNIQSMAGWTTTTLTFTNGSTQTIIHPTIGALTDWDVEEFRAEQQHSSESGKVLPVISGVAAQARYKTRDKAAQAAERDALKAAADSSRTYVYEYGGWIIRDANGFTYTIPVTFYESGHFYTEDVTVPHGFKAVADYHTHPSASNEGEGFSGPDAAHAEFFHRVIYVADMHTRNMYRFTPGVTPYMGVDRVTGDFVAHIP